MMEYKIWTMRDGSQIEVKKMTTLHVKNCLAMLEKNIGIIENNARFFKEFSSRWQKQIDSIAARLDDRKRASQEKADSHLMMADLKTEQDLEFTENWIKVFREELYKRETN